MIFQYQIKSSFVFYELTFTLKMVSNCFLKCVNSKCTIKIAKTALTVGQNVPQNLNMFLWLSRLARNCHSVTSIWCNTLTHFPGHPRLILKILKIAGWFAGSWSGLLEWLSGNLVSARQLVMIDRWNQEVLRFLSTDVKSELNLIPKHLNWCKN